MRRRCSSYFLFMIHLFLALSSLLYVSFSNQAAGQAIGSGLNGACIPHQEAEGPWECKVDKPYLVICTAEETHRFEQDWNSSSSSDNITQQIKSEYLRTNDILKLSRWLACHGYFIYLSSLGSWIKGEDTTLNYLAIERDHKGLLQNLNDLIFWRGPVEIGISLNRFGQIERIHYRAKTDWQE